MTQTTRIMSDPTSKTTDLPVSIAKSRSRTLMAAKNFTRLMNEFEGEIKYCGEALEEVMDAADQLIALEAMQRPTGAPKMADEAFEIWPLGVSGEPGVGITISLPENPNRVWLCWDETVELHAWLANLVEAEKCPAAVIPVQPLRSLLQDVMDDMTFNVAPSKGTMAKISEALKNV